MIDIDEYKEALEALKSEFLDKADLEPYMQIICNALEKQIPKKFKTEMLQTNIHGVKIFEGDIVRDDDGDVMMVKWLTEGAVFVLEPKPYVSVHFYSTLPSRIEVIGNIYDNRELLKE